MGCSERAKQQLPRHSEIPINKLRIQFYFNGEFSGVYRKSSLYRPGKILRSLVSNPGQGGPARLICLELSVSPRALAVATQNFTSCFQHLSSVIRILSS